MKLPKKINPCPILDALIEIRFSTNINRDAVFGLIYNALHSDFEKVDKLPIMQLPDQVRDSDPSLKFKPHYRLSNENIVVQVGPDVITISSYPKYTGWNSFSSKIYDILEKVQNIGIIDSIIRIGIRYINFFEQNIFDDINLKVTLSENTIDYKNTVIRTEISQDNYKSTLQIANNANHNNKSGSVIDIDTFMDNNIDDFFHRKKEIIDNGHEKEKELFFSLLKEEFLNTLNPEY
ncbi:MAG: TIGR04255 family protein [Bacteroidales bacterium]|nr:TIGR04255 family protein [Bacteroidales bacterium]MBS3774670.1 TIGR04255 family protein [Bacteroidales bacterium]